MTVPQRIVITGGPGAGKTILLDALGSQGFTIVDETARSIIQERRERGLSRRPEPLQFAEEILRRDIEKYNRPYPESDYIFFDRSVLDALCMLDQATPLQEKKLNTIVAKYPYSRQVFFLPPWEAIYTNDAERDQTFTEAIHVYETLLKWYRWCGYEVINLPKLPVVDRCAYILQVIPSFPHVK